MSSTHKVQYGNTSIEYMLIYSPRKTLGIDVQPDLRVAVKAPAGTGLLRLRLESKNAPPEFCASSASLKSTCPNCRPVSTSAARRGVTWAGNTG